MSRGLTKTNGQAFIDVQMINDLLNAGAVIADLSASKIQMPLRDRNSSHGGKANYPHAVGDRNSAFDVNLFREIKFSRQQHSEIEKAKTELKLAVEDSADGYQLTNPVTNARGYLKLEQTGTPEIRVLMDEMDSIKSRVDSMQRQLNILMSRPDNLSYASAVLDVQSGRVERFGSGGWAIPPNTSTGRLYPRRRVIRIVPWRPVWPATRVPPIEKRERRFTARQRCRDRRFCFAFDESRQRSLRVVRELVVYLT